VCSLWRRLGALNEQQFFEKVLLTTPQHRLPVSRITCALLRLGISSYNRLHACLKTRLFLQFGTFFFFHLFHRYHAPFSHAIWRRGFLRLHGKDRGMYAR
jgi:hypothetical protein